jgi:hypothetical protein
MINKRKKSVGPDFIIGFGKHRGLSLEKISESDPGYIIWLAEENVLQIKEDLLAQVRAELAQEESEARDIINEYRFE